MRRCAAPRPRLGSWPHAYACLDMPSICWKLGGSATVPVWNALMLGDLGQDSWQEGGLRGSFGGQNCRLTSREQGQADCFGFAGILPVGEHSEGEMGSEQLGMRVGRGFAA